MSLDPTPIGEWIHTIVEFCLLLATLGVGRVLRRIYKTINLAHGHKERVGPLHAENIQRLRESAD